MREILENVNADRAEMNEINLLPEFNIGDKVLLYDPTTNVGLSKKLVRRWRGIYIIIEKLSEVTYTIMKDEKTQKVNIERLRKYNENDIDSIECDRFELQLAQQEVEALNNTIRDLEERRNIIEQEKNIIQANNEIKVLENNMENGEIVLRTTGINIDFPFSMMWV